MLINDEGHEIMRQCVLDLKNKAAGSKMHTKLAPSEEIDLKGLAFNAGCTSCVVLITKDTIYCANSGDSRACLATKKGKVIELSHDHKPDNEGELKRVKAGGGFVEDGRVQGVIAVSRAIGDWEYKNPKLLSELEGKKRKSLKKKKGEAAEAEPASPGIKGSYPGAGKTYRNIEESKKH
jgi:serine/threonine protein phosphatase PrpC